MAAAVLGLRGSGNFTTVERPRNWRQELLLQFPNGDAPLLALLSKLKEEPTDDPEYAWWEKGLGVQRFTLSGASLTLTAQPASATLAGATSTQTSIALNVIPDGGATGDITAIKAGHLLYNQVGDEVYLVIKADRVNNFIVVQRNIGGQYTLGTNDPAITANGGTTGDTVVISGTGFPEGAPIGTAIAYQPAKYSNFTTIQRTPLFLTRTARKTRLRWDATGPYYEARREALQIHGREIEWSFFFSERSENTAILNPDAPLDVTSSGAPLRTTRGLIRWLPAITAVAGTPSIHYNLTTGNGGLLTETLFDGFLEEAMRFGSKEKVGFCGSTALNVLTQLAKNKSTIELVPTDQTYGMHMVRYLSPFGTLFLVNHPLLSNDPVFRKDLWVLDIDKLMYRYITDTTFLENRQNPGDDASKDEFLTECGLEVHFSGATPDSGGVGGSGASPNTIATPAAHGRLKGIAAYGG